MIRSQPKFRLATRELPIGPVPLVVGTLSSIRPGFPASASDIPSDVVELRVDSMPADAEWLAQGRLIESLGTPVLVTIRIKAEGGSWQGRDKDRLQIFEKALSHLSGVDVEFESEIARPVVQMAADAGKTSIVSYHDFDQTPTRGDLQRIIEKAREFAPVIKLSTMIKGEQDEGTLRELLSTDWGVPLCVIGMGEKGTQTRVEFAALGSCLTYGYLDKLNAPGQLSAAELVRQLRKLLPRYDEECKSRKPQLV